MGGQFYIFRDQVPSRFTLISVLPNIFTMFAKKVKNAQNASALEEQPAPNSLFKMLQSTLQVVSENMEEMEKTDFQQGRMSMGSHWSDTDELAKYPRYHVRNSA